MTGLARLAVARLKFATNRFNSVPTAQEDLHGRHALDDGELAAVLEFGRMHPDWEIELLVSATARPGGALEDAVWTSLVQKVMDGLASGSFDAALLLLQGAARTATQESPELDLIRAVRSAIGTRPLGVVFDHRANIGANLPPLVDIALGARIGSGTRPPARVTRTVLAELVRRHQGAPRLQSALATTPFTLAAPATDAAAGVLDELDALAQDAASVFTGFPYSDVPQACASVLAWAETQERARERVRETGSRLVALRGTFRLGLPGPNLALRQALEESSPGQLVIVTDPADAPEYGGAGDSTALLRCLLELRPVRPAAIAFFADPHALASAIRTGVGNSLDLSLGARFSRDFGAALPVRAKVESIMLNAGAFGRTAAISVEGVMIALSERTACIDSLEDLHRLGLNPDTLHLLALKTGMQVAPPLAALARRVIACDAAGPAALDLASLDLRNLRTR